MCNKLFICLRQKKAFSLIEVMIFIAILSILFVVAIAYVTNLMRMMKINEHKIIATYYAEEVREWLKSEKETDWDAFSQKAGYVDSTSGSAFTYCFNEDITITDTIAQMALKSDNGKFPREVCTAYTGIGTQAPRIFRRTVVLKKDSEIAPTTVEALITVSWLEAGTEYKVPLNATFSVWE